MGAPSFINPIIQAYSAGRAHGLERARILQEGQLGQQRIEQESERIKNEKNEHEASLKQASDLAAAARDLQKQQIDLEAEKNTFEQKVKGIDLLGKVATGEIKPVAQTGEQPPQGAFQIPTQEHLGYFSPNDPQAILAHIQAEHEAIAKGQSQGSLPAQQTLLTQQGQQASALQAQEAQARQAQEESRQKFELGENALNRNAQAAIAKSSQGTQYAIANMADQTRKLGYNLEYNPSPEAVGSMIHAFATGQAKPNLNSPQERAAYTVMTQNGFRPLDPKVVSSLQQYEDVNKTFDNMEKLIKENFPTSTIAATANGIRYALPGSGSTDLKNKMGDIGTQVTNIGRFEEGLGGGRILSSQLQNELEGLPKLNQTKKQALEHVANLRQQAQKIVQSAVGGTPPPQIELLNKTYGTQIPKYQSFAKDPTTGHVIGISAGKVYDAQTDQPLSAPPSGGTQQ